MNTAYGLLLLLFPVLSTAAPATISGRVLDETGAPVAGARVWIVHRQPYLAEPEVMGRATADGGGRFSVPDVEMGLPSLVYGPLAVAYREGLAVAHQELPFDAVALGHVGLQSPPAVARAGRLVDGTGKGVVARVGPASLPGGADASAQLPEELTDAMAVETDEEGRFSTSIAPARHALRLVARTEVFGRAQMTLGTGDQAPVVISPPGAVRVRLVCEESPEATSGVGPLAASVPYHFPAYSREKGTTDADGTALLWPLQPGLTSVTFRFPPGARRQAHPVEVQVKSGETAQVRVELRPASEVTGRVIDAVTQEPVAGIGVWCFDGARALVQSVTDAQGIYRFLALPGTLRLSVHRLPVAYWSPEAGVPSVQVTVAHEPVRARDIELVSFVRLDGVVVDAGGRPVARGLVYGHRGGYGKPVECDDAGRFAITVARRPARIDPQMWSPRRLWARSGDLMTRDRPAVDADGEAPLRLVVEEGVACRIAVQAVHPDGAPMPDADVAVEWWPERGGGPATDRPDVGRTGGDGRLLSQALLPFGSYAAAVSRAGCRTVRSERWTAAAGEVHDVGALTLLEASSTVAGRVVDLDGRPVTAATVYANGEGLGKLVTQTDARGAFQLAGLYAGPTWIVARLGDALGGVKVQAGSLDATITLAPIPQAPQVSEVRDLRPLTDAEADRRIALELLEEITGRVPVEDHRARSGLVSTWAISDPERALALVGDAEWLVKTALEVAAHSVSGRDPRAALGYIERMARPEDQAGSLVGIAGRMAADHPELVRDFLLRAVAAAEEVVEPAQKAVRLAQAAGALWDADPAAAEPLLREAEALARGLGEEKDATYPRVHVADALCRMYLPAALSLLDGDTDAGLVAQRRGRIAARIAAHEPEKAVELMSGVVPKERDRLLAEVAYAMAPTAPDRAIDLAGSAQDRLHRARALGYAALAAAEAAPERAAAALEEAVGALATYEGGTAQPAADFVASELALIAARLGHPAAEWATWLALSLRPPELSESAYPHDCGHLRALAVANPPMTAELIRDVRAQQGLLTFANDGRRVFSLLAAATVCDTHLAAELLRELSHSAEFKSDSGRAWFQALRCLLTDPADRPARVLQWGTVWVPGAPRPVWE